MEEYPWNPRIVDGERLPRKLKKRLQKENVEIERARQEYHE